MSGGQRITPMLWFDGKAEEASAFYVSLFNKSAVRSELPYGEAGKEIHGQKAGSVMTVDFEISGQKMVALNGGPMFQLTPAISFYVVCETVDEVDRLWDGLAEGGTVLLPLAQYPWSSRYGWIQDRFGVSWQLGLGKFSEVGQKVTPFLTFVPKDRGLAAEALKLYTSTFPNSSIDGILNFDPEQGMPPGSVQHAQFALSGEKLMVIDSTDHAFGFTEAISFIVACETQMEIDHYWEKLLSGGGTPSQCGWLKDRFGVSWQIVPSALHRMLSSGDKARTERVTRAFLGMTKFDLAALERAFAGDVK